MKHWFWGFKKWPKTEGSKSCCTREPTQGLSRIMAQQFLFSFGNSELLLCFLLYQIDTRKYLGLGLHCVASKPDSLDLMILPNTIHYFMLESIILNSFFFPHLTISSSFETQHFISSHYALLTYNVNACLWVSIKQKDIIDFACFVVLPSHSPIFISWYSIAWGKMQN